MKPRIVILSAFLTPFRSGAEACSEEVPSVLKDRFDFTIVTARMRRNLPRRDRLNSGIPIVRVGLGYTVDKWLFPFLAPLAAARLKPQIIHAVLESFAGLALVFCRFICPGSKRMLTMQTTNRRFLKRLIVRSGDAVTAISQVLVQTARSFGRSDVVHIPNGVHLADIPELPKVPGRILFVGRLEQWKGVDLLLKAVAAISSSDHAKVKAMHVRIIGDGNYRSHLEKLANELGIADLVEFTGWVKVPAVFSEYAQAEIFCGLSRSEALGNVFFEAQAAGCAVVGTKVGGIPDIITTGKTGILVESEDYQAAAVALEKLLTDDEHCRQLAAAGKASAQKYDWAAVAGRYGEMYEGLDVDMPQISSCKLH